MADNTGNSVLKAALELAAPAEADGIVQVQRTEIESRWKGPYSLGISAKSVKKGKVKKGQNGRYITVYPQEEKVYHAYLDSKNK